jgi:hypothetical protein
LIDLLHWSHLSEPDQFKHPQSLRRYPSAAPTLCLQR